MNFDRFKWIRKPVDFKIEPDRIEITTEPHTDRIYNTRNSLVHSKSGQSDKQYKPQKHKSILAKELPLIQVISEMILFENGDVL